MLDCTAVRIPGALFLVALAVRIVTGLGYPDPAYPDSLYYANVARELAARQLFQVDYIWSFVEVGGRIPADPVLPIPSNAHWMPLAAVIQVPFIWLFGTDPLVQGVPFWLISALAAPLTYAIGLDAGLKRGQAVAAGILVAIPGLLSQFMSQTDNFALFMPLGALALWACGRGFRGDTRAFVLGGAVVGLATLSRNDGVLLGVPFALGFLVQRFRLRRLSNGSPRIGWAAALACAGAFLAVAGPWYLRQLAVFGSLSPSAANGRILWIRNYHDLYSASGETTLASFLAQGPEALLASRAGGVAMALILFAGLPLMLYLVPFTALGAWIRRQDRMFIPWFIYAATLFAFNGLLFAVHVPFGTFLHSAVAIVPHAYLLAVLGIAAVVEWVAQRRRHWNAPRATRNFTIAAVIFALLGAAGATWRNEVSWRREADLRSPIVAELARRGPGDRVMSPDAGAYRFHAGSPGIVTPNDPLPVIEVALRGYQVRWLVLERDHMVPALAPLLDGEERPAWLSAPIVAVQRDTEGNRTSATAPSAGPAAASLYAVCFEPSDDRCS